MQLLTFTVAGNCYAIEARHVVEVLPLVAARAVPHQPPHVLGVFTYRGSLVPLVDLGRLLAGRPPEERLGTRVIVVEPPAGPASAARRLGLVAERVISVSDAGRVDASLPALDPAGAPWLGPLLRLAGGTLQMLDVGHILPADAAAGLPPTPEAAAP